MYIVHRHSRCSNRVFHYTSVLTNRTITRSWTGLCRWTQVMTSLTAGLTSRLHATNGSVSHGSLTAAQRQWFDDLLLLLFTSSTASFKYAHPPASLFAVQWQFLICRPKTLILSAQCVSSIGQIIKLETRSVERGICPIAKFTMTELFL